MLLLYLISHLNSLKFNAKQSLTTSSGVKNSSKSAENVNNYIFVLLVAKTVRCENNTP